MILRYSNPTETGVETCLVRLISRVGMYLFFGDIFWQQRFHMLQIRESVTISEFFISVFLYEKWFQKV